MEFTTDWHHAPPHWLENKGIYIVTGATLHKQHFFNDPLSRNWLLGQFFDVCGEFAWDLHAWSLFSNHYHFIADSPDDPKSLKRMLGKLHMLTSKWANERDRTPGRKVWYQYWDTRITFQRSYWPRLRYVHENPVKHGLVSDPTEYPWCSAAWFKAKATSAQQRKMASFNTHKLKLYDEFDPL